MTKFYAITPENFLPQHEVMLKKWLDSGLTMVQYRRKNASLAIMKEEIKKILSILTPYKAKLIINDFLELAIEFDCDGVHFGQADLSLLAQKKESLHGIKSWWGKDKIIGVTCHSSLELCQKSICDGASYVSLGACFPSVTKPNAPLLDWGVLPKLQEMNIPFCLIGGINQNNIQQLKNYRPTYIAASHYFFGGKSPHTWQRESFLT